jgi:hypothetical protein
MAERADLIEATAASVSARTLSASSNWGGVLIALIVIHILAAPEAGCRLWPVSARRR